MVEVFLFPPFWNRNLSPPDADERKGGRPIILELKLPELYIVKSFPLSLILRAAAGNLLKYLQSSSNISPSGGWLAYLQDPEYLFCLNLSFDNWMLTINVCPHTHSMTQASTPDHAFMKHYGYFLSSVSVLISHRLYEICNVKSSVIFVKKLKVKG